MNLSPHFTLEEATRSAAAARLGINNLPTLTEKAVIRRTAEQMEQVRALLGDQPVHVDSWFRSEALNEAVGGVSNSAHRLGYAVDFVCPGFGTITDICRAIAASGIRFDQLIWECDRWAHISFDPRYRGETLTTHDARTYSRGLPA